MFGNKSIYDVAVSRVVDLLNDKLPAFDNGALSLVSGLLDEEKGVWCVDACLSGDQRDRISGYVKLPGYPKEDTREACEAGIHYVTQMADLLNKFGIEHKITSIKARSVLQIEFPASQALYVLQTEESFGRFVQGLDSFNHDYTDYSSSHYAMMRQRHSNSYQIGVSETFQLLKLQDVHLRDPQVSFDYAPISPMQAQMVLRNSAVSLFKNKVLRPLGDMMLSVNLCELREDKHLQDRYVRKNSLVHEFQDETAGLSLPNAMIVWFSNDKVTNPYWIGKNLFALSDNLKQSNIGHRLFISKDQQNRPCFGISASVNDYEFMHRLDSNIDSVMFQMTMDGTGQGLFAKGTLQDRFEQIVSEKGGVDFYNACMQNLPVSPEGNDFLVRCIDYVIQRGAQSPQPKRQYA